MKSNHTKIVAFDTDGCLIHLTGPKEDTPRYEVIELFRMYELLGCHMVVWSGGGVDYAERWCRKLGLTAQVVHKGSYEVAGLIPDIAFDDEEVLLGKVNIRV